MTAFRLAVPLMVLAVTSSVAAREAVTTTIDREIALPAGATLRVENLLGAISVRAADLNGVARIEARVVAEADTDGAARRLAAGVTLETIADGWVRFAFPEGDMTGYRLPRSEASGVMSKWVGPLLDRKGANVDYADRSVVVGSVKGAAAVAVFVTVTVPYDVDASFLQSVGSLRGSGLRGRLDLESVDGDQLIEQMYGRLTARSVGGRIDVRQFHGEELTLDTASGDIALTSVRADEARLRTVDGAIEGQGIAMASLRVDTGSGGVRLVDVDAVALEIRTASGDVDLGTQLRSARSASIRSESGDVTLRLGRLVPFELVAEPGKGSVKSKDLAVEIVEDGRTTTVRRGQGGARLEIASGGGTIELRSL